MRIFCVSPILVLSAMLVSGSAATAQYPQGYPQYRPRYPSVPSYYPPAYTPRYDPQAEAYIRSLYRQVLSREPEPKGMRTWLRRLQQLGGDYQRMTREFYDAANLELNANNPAYRYPPAQSPWPWPYR